jgi:hypothetical protein
MLEPVSSGPHPGDRIKGLITMPPSPQLAEPVGFTRVMHAVLGGYIEHQG